MFRDEAALASRLEHQNVCRVFTLGNTAGTWYIVMEYLHGVALSRMLSRMSRTKQRMDLRLAAAIVVQACEGLHHAHDLRGADGALLNVVHRDVSPPNIFLGADGMVKLLDFGIAKARGAGSKTRTGTVKGKNAYMSPEQILGKPLDRRSDVFALGAVLYELVTVKRLFHRDSDFLTFKAITEEPIPDVRERRPDLPPVLREVIHRALARDIGGRYATARDMAEAVKAAVESLGGPATPAELGKVVSTDFSEELAAKQELCEQAATAPVGADSSTIPSLTLSSGQHMAVAPTVVDKPKSRGNTLSALEGELQTPPPRSPKSKTTPPPIPSAAMKSPTPTSPVMVEMPAAAVVVAPLAMVPGTGETTFTGAPIPDVSLDLRPRSGVGVKVAIAVGVVVLAAVAFALAAGGGGSKAATAPPDAEPMQAPVPIGERRTIDEARDAGMSRAEIELLSLYGYLTVGSAEKAVVLIDGRSIGEEVGPDKDLDRYPLKPGPHQLKLVGPKKKVHTQKFDIIGGQENDLGTVTWDQK
jgi:serine/threonine-protein kinase